MDGRRSDARKMRRRRREKKIRKCPSEQTKCVSGWRRKTGTSASEGKEWDPRCWDPMSGTCWDDWDGGRRWAPMESRSRVGRQRKSDSDRNRNRPGVADAIARKLYGDDAVRHNKRKPRQAGQSTIKYSTVTVLSRSWAAAITVSTSLLGEETIRRSCVQQPTDIDNNDDKDVQRPVVEGKTWAGGLTLVFFLSDFDVINQKRPTGPKSAT
ncbi:uncharacterized protein BKA55DRAFT_536313 [Fusarium redolens]|uniref:Uncharacterized protein n=1 Tax=Fusarium redolens TaxID=48865 RepID=A0A9P9HQL0_FUSRE|nr:uncharacterized protein BKA55DRAFT_536313 [Fusarium redolens]KAH7261308.1 hypothetical protein BKA55DRAFT_536313 [Fusarium redolens]